LHACIGCIESIDGRVSKGEASMFTRRKAFIFILNAGGLALFSRYSVGQGLGTIDKGSPDRSAILNLVRASVEQRLGIKVIFEVDRMTTYRGWAYAALRPRTQYGTRIDYRKTRYASSYQSDLDSDSIDVLLRRSGSSWAIAQQAFLPTDVVWEEWVKTYRLPRNLFIDD
jgi:hypothetical protein